MPLPHPGLDAVPFTPLTAEFLDNMNENIESLATGTGLNDGAVGIKNLSQLTTNDIIVERAPIGYALTGSFYRIGWLVFLTVSGTTSLPTATKTVPETLPVKFRPAEAINQVHLVLTAVNSTKLRAHAMFWLSAVGRITCVASDSHNEWYGTACWITDQPL